MVKNRKDLTPRRSFRSNLTRAKSAAANIKVVVRVRPQNHRENGDNHRIVVKAIDEQMLIFDPEEDNTPFFFHGVEQKGRDLLKKQRKNMKFSFDKVFTHDSDNEDVFIDSTCGLIETLMDGCNCSVFAYGATGAGKTHTMLGHNDAPGITLLTMRELFRQKEELALERDFELAVSYLEVYNENVQDLLKPGGPPLHLREDAKLGVMVAGITIQRIESAEQLFDLLDKGNKCRTQHATDSNAESSRSHAVFQVYIRMNIKLSGQSRLAKLSLIDLAGSEKGAATGFKGARFTEGSNINKSLLALGNCINSLADGQKHIPYRDSKLTRLLKDSLGGNCHTVMIANVSPSSLSYEDTYNTLKYATRAKKIKANVKKNVMNSDLSSTQYLKIIEDLNKENLRLKEALKTTVTTSTSCENCEGSSSGSSIVLQIPEIVNPSPATATLDQLFEEYKSVQERYYRLKSNYSMLQARVNIKEEANNRLSGFCVDTGDKELGHKKLLQTMDRLKRQAGAISPDLQVLDNKLQAIYKNIQEIVQQNPDLKLKAECEMLKIEKIKLETKIDEEKSIKKVQEAELQVRGMLLEDMATLMQPWYLLLRGNGCATETLTTDYKNLCKRLQGACTVSFEDGECTSDTASAINRTNEEEIRSAVKRKLPQDMDSTFVLSPVAAIDNKIGAAQLLAKVCHTPAKRPAKGVKSSPRILHKENKIVGRKAVVGTMGTSARFPASVSSLANKNAVKLLTRQPLKQRSKI